MLKTAPAAPAPAAPAREALGAAPQPSAPVIPIRREPPAEPRIEVNGQPEQDGRERERAAPVPPRPAAAPPQANGGGDQRRTLHLSLGNGKAGGQNGHHTGNGHGVGHDAEPARQPFFAAPIPQSGAAERPPVPFQPAPQRPPPVTNGSYGRQYAENGRPLTPQRDAEAARSKDGGNFIDQALRSRVDSDIAAFLAAFDAALAADTQESRFGLREATDRLLRAGARTRIELERLEARVPLADPRLR